MGHADQYCANFLLVRCRYVCVAGCLTLLCDSRAVRILVREVQEIFRQVLFRAQDQGTVPADPLSEEAQSPSQLLDEDRLCS